MSVSDIIGYIITVLSFLSVVIPALHIENRPLLYLLMVFAGVLSVGMFLVLYYKQSREYTLYVLSMENRTLSLRLLLTHSWLSQIKNPYVDKFSPSKLHMVKACYEFMFERSRENGNIYDMKCRYTFTIKRSWRSPRDFDVLIMQPGGREIRSIQYAFGEYSYVYDANTEPIRLSGSNKKLPTFWRARIPFNGKKDVDKLIVSYTMPEVDRIDDKSLGDSIIICPFIYAKRVDSIAFKIKYPGYVSHVPRVICLKRYPYNGRRYTPRKLLNFQAEDNALTWSACPETCMAQAVYVIELHDPVPNCSAGEF